MIIFVLVPKLEDAVVLAKADDPFASLGAYELFVTRPLSYPFIFTVNELIVALLGISLKLKPRKYKYLFDVDAVILVIVAYVVLSVFAYILLAFSTLRYDVLETAYVLGINLIVAITIFLYYFISKLGGFHFLHPPNLILSIKFRFHLTCLQVDVTVNTL